MTQFINDLYLICSMIVIMYVWYDTDAFIEWAQKFHLKFLKYKEYYDIKNGPMGRVIHLYNDFLLMQYGKNFFFRLLTCEICASTWLNILALSVFNGSVGGFKVLGFNILMTWILYFASRAAMKQLVK